MTETSWRFAPGSRTPPTVPGGDPALRRGRWVQQSGSLPAKIAWSSTGACAICVSARVFTSRALPWIRSAIPADPLGCKAVETISADTPQKSLKLLHQHWGMAAVKDGRRTMPTLAAWMASPVPAVRAPNAHPILLNYKSRQPDPFDLNRT